MANTLQKWSEDDSLTLQVTRPARDRAGLVDEDADGEPIHLADVFVYVFDDVLLVVDAVKVSAADRAQLVAVASQQTDSIYSGRQTSITTAGNGYKVNLPGCSDGGFTQGQTAPVVAGPGMLAIHRLDEGSDVAQQLVTNRRRQTDGGTDVAE
jgi:hypothetical protein